MPAQTTPKKYYSTREAAKLLGVSLTTVQSMVEKGELQAWKTSGGHRRIGEDAVQKALNQRQPGGSVERAGSSKYSILIAEDDPVLCKLYEKTIGTWKMPIDLTIVQNGIEVTFLIERTRPDLLILDLKMPRMDVFSCSKSFAAIPNMMRWISLSLAAWTAPISPNAVASRRVWRNFRSRYRGNSCAALCRRRCRGGS